MPRNALKTIAQMCTLAIGLHALAGCCSPSIQSNNDTQPIQALLNYKNRELRPLDSDDRNKIKLLVANIAPSPLYPAYICEMHANTGNSLYVVYIELPYKEGYPGINRMSATVIDPTQHLSTNYEDREFYIGSRVIVTSMCVRTNYSEIGLPDILVVNFEQGGPLHAQTGKDFYALVHTKDSDVPTLRLLRREGPNKTAMRLNFTQRWHTCNRLMGPTVPVYNDNFAWATTLKHGTTVDVLSVLLFLNSEHSYQNYRNYQNTIEHEVPIYLEQTGVINTLQTNTNPWIREYSNMLKRKAGKRCKALAPPLDN
jgi:hypothetical protein